MTAKSVLRITTAGSVDDGKSTLIGRLLFAGGAVYDDQREVLEKSLKIQGELDFSLLADGLKAEREQGITIDVAYKYFQTKVRKYILSDAPGHLQYTRNMVTAASRADLAIVLVDARKGVVEQTRRHSYLIHMLGVPHLVVAINKIDAIAYDDAIIQEISKEFRALPWVSSHQSVHVIPISALKGDNVAHISHQTPFYRGPSLLELLDSIEVHRDHKSSFKLSIQHLIRDGNGARWVLGAVNEGALRVGEEVKILPGSRMSSVAELYVSGEPRDGAQKGDVIALRLGDEIDLQRGGLLSSHDHAEGGISHFYANLVWFDQEALQHSRHYILRLANHSVRARVQEVESRFNLTTLAHEPATALTMNDVGLVTVETFSPVYAQEYAASRNFGAFILIDPITNRTVAAGMIGAVKENGPPSTEVILATQDEWLSDAQGDSLFLPADFLVLNGGRRSSEIVTGLVNQGYRVVLEQSAESSRVLSKIRELNPSFFTDGLGI